MDEDRPHYAHAVKILLASSEVYPYSKSGGLADMIAALAKFLERAGHQVGLITPLYRGIRERFPSIQPLDWNLEVPLGNDVIKGKIWVRHLAGGLTIYFVDHPPFFDRPELHTERGADYPDNAERFLFFCKSVVNLAHYLPWKPDMVHVHDWQTAGVAMLSADEKRRGWHPAPPVCLTIHNLAFQGAFAASKFALTNLPPEYFRPGIHGVLRRHKLSQGRNCLCRRDYHRQPRYAREITTTQFGCGLDGVLRSRRDALIGILNGVDYDEWTTVANPYLSHSYNAGDLRGKAANKADLQAELKLPVRPEVPLFGTVARLADQKGWTSSSAPWKKCWPRTCNLCCSAMVDAISNGPTAAWPCATRTNARSKLVLTPRCPTASSRPAISS